MRVSETLRRERDLLSAILEGMREAVLVLDSDRRILLANSALREFLLPGPDVVGKTTLEVLPPSLEWAIGEAREGGREGACEVEGATLGVPDDARSFAEIIRRQAEQLSHLVDDLLDLSRIESGALALSPEPIDLGEALAAVAAHFEERARARSIRIAVAAGAAAPPALADRSALRHVLHNLVDNACKSADEGSVVTLRASADGASLAVSVEDTGPGIAPHHLLRLFERLYRVDPSRSRALGGTGLGLAIVKHLVEAMGGEVAVTSALGRGTTLRFTLPSSR